MMRVYVTGAKGFAGFYLTTYLKSLGIEVFGSSINLADKDSLKVELALFNPEYVIHLAASSFVANKDVDSFYMVNIVGTRNLLEALYLACPNVAKVIVTSSAAVYGNSDVEIINEAVLPSPANDYGVSKLAMEFACRLWFKRLPIVITRPFNFTGVGQSTNFVIPKIVEHFKARKKTIELGNIDVYREFGDVRDFVQHYYQLLISGVSGQVYNICTGKLHSLRDIMMYCEKITGNHVEIQVNSELVRVGEIARLGGDPSLLFSVVNRKSIYSVDNTLEWMLKD